MRALDTLGDLDAALAAAAARPILIFKHSPSCGLSAMANEEVELLGDDPDLSGRIYRVLVGQGRAVSNEIASRLRVRHQSPQALLVENDAVRWHASHSRVTADQIRRALQSLTAEPSR